jgi:hypothetical protein
MRRPTTNRAEEGRELMPPRRSDLGRVILLFSLTLGLACPLWASHLAVRLTVDGDPRPAQADTDTTPPPSGKKPRPLLRARMSDPVKLHWSVKNTAGKKLEKLLVHLFIVREAKAGQPEVPDPRKSAVWETVQATALDPGKVTHGDVEVPIGEPGIYLVRVESGFTEQDHEHFAAVDLQVE